jgi:alcohol dehydrogenase (cytochrome c)
MEMSRRLSSKAAIYQLKFIASALAAAVCSVSAFGAGPDNGPAQDKETKLAAAAMGTSTVATGPGDINKIKANRRTDTDWPTYNNGFLSQRFSKLTQINTRNVSSIKEVCRIELAVADSLHTGPLMIDGVMYATTVRDTFAINPADCTLLWKSTWVPEQNDVYRTNRGVAYLDGRLFRGTADGRILALDAKTGKQLWKVVAGDPGKGEFFSAAPIAKDGLVYMGTAGSDWGIRGRMMAFDAATGKEVWRFNTVPLPQEPGAETWNSEMAASTGGGGMWSSFTLDEKTNELFVPVGNPAPDFLPGSRTGDNLYTNSVVVLDAKTGKLKWWYQLTPNDGLDLDLGAPPVLYKDAFGVDLLAVGGKDGYVYLIDRSTKKLRARTAVTTINGAGPPTPEGVLSCPGPLGGVEWNGPALDPVNNALYVGAVDWCATIKSAPSEYKRGNFFMAGTFEFVKTPPNGWITALDAGTGQVKWKYEVGTSMVAGITPTAGGLVLTGDIAGNFLALDSKTGKVRHKIDTGGAVAGGVITYAIAGKQYVATTSGNVSRLTFGVLGKPSIVILALDPILKEQAKTPFAGPVNAAPAQARLAKGVEQSDVERGKAAYGTACAACHGSKGEGGIGKSLQSLDARMSWENTVDKIVNPQPPMPKLYPSVFSEQDVVDIAAYIRTFR